jgi:hypothetical protein
MEAEGRAEKQAREPMTPLRNATDQAGGSVRAFLRQWHFAAY